MSLYVCLSVCVHAPHRHSLWTLHALGPRWASETLRKQAKCEEEAYQLNKDYPVRSGTCRQPSNVIRLRLLNTEAELVVQGIEPGFHDGRLIPLGAD